MCVFMKIIGLFIICSGCYRMASLYNELLPASYQLESLLVLLYNLVVFRILVVDKDHDQPRRTTRWSGLRWPRKILFCCGSLVLFVWAACCVFCFYMLSFKQSMTTELGHEQVSCLHMRVMKSWGSLRACAVLFVSLLSAFEGEGVRFQRKQLFHFLVCLQSY